ncbi:hypothetical protein [Caballeronia sp.]|uniref:hypothetical protein n=1 Tax=Caballeronia sp. TaxID=1931223 RepID=UPI003C49033F
MYTHSHADPYGGIRGIVDEADLKAGKVKIYAPAGFAEAAVGENVIAGKKGFSRFRCVQLDKQIGIDWHDWHYQLRD